MKKLTQRERVKRHLETHGSVTNVEAIQMQILRLSERIRELQAEGMEISGDWVRVDGKKTGTFRYSLVGGPKPKLEMRVVERDGVRVARMIKVAA